jgi:hypothetical protein
VERMVPGSVPTASINGRRCILWPSAPNRFPVVEYFTVG